MNTPNKKPIPTGVLPDGTWAVSKEDKPKIRAFGRKLVEFIRQYAKEEGGGTFHTKLVAGGFQYFMDVQSQLSKLVGDDLVLAAKVLTENALGDKIEEPFADAPEPAPVERASVPPKAGEDVPGPTAPADAPAPAPAVEAPAVDAPADAPAPAPATDPVDVPAEEVPAEEVAAPEAPEAPKAPEAPAPVN